MADAENQEEQNKNQTVSSEPNQAYSQYIDPDFKEKQKKKKLLLIVGVAIAILAILVVVAIIAFSASSDQKGAPAEPAETVKACEDERCFEEQFALCQMAVYEGQGPEENSKVEYKIPGITEVGCLVTVKYLESTDTEIIGKEMTCDFDNEVPFNESLSLVKEYPDDYECEGELVIYL
jgi:hypothetical protein